MIDLKCIPDALKEGENWHLLDLDPEWIWLVRGEGDEPVGMLIASWCHGLVFIFRVKVLPSAPPWSLGRLLRTFVRDIRRRGALGYIATLDVNRPEEAALMRIAYRGGAIIGGATTMVFGSATVRRLSEGR